MKVTPYIKGMDIVAPCLISGMPNDVYHAHQSISKTGLDKVNQSPAHYFYAGKQDSTRAMEIGSAIHTAILEPEIFASKYVLLRSVSDRRASEYKQAASVHGGEYVLTGPEADDLVGMVESIYSQPGIASWLRAEGMREVSLFVNDPETGVLVRARYDLLIPGLSTVIDLKKTQDARPDAFAKSVFNYRHHVQAAFYSDAWEWATGEKIESFRFLAVEPKAPNAVKLYRIDRTALDEGRNEYRQDLDRYAECLKSGEWPAYENADDDVISLPEWRLRQIENDMEVMMEDE